MDMGSVLRLMKEIERGLSRSANERKAQRAHFEAKARHYEAKVRQHEMRINPPAVHGAAGWATFRDLDAKGWMHAFEAALKGQPKGYLNPRATDIYLGGIACDPEAREREDGWFYWQDEGHLSTFAPTRSGKSALHIVHTLLRHKGSAIVLDPKGELFRLTSRWRHQVGQEVYRIAPFDEEQPGDAFNPLESVTTSEEARVLAELLYPRRSDGDGAYFEDDAIAFLTAAILYVCYQEPPETRNLHRLRDLTATDPKGLQTLITKMQAEEMPPVIRRAAAVLSGGSTNANRQLLRSLHSRLSLWDVEGLSLATAYSAFRWEDLKRKPVTVYVELPFDKMEPFGPFVSVLVNCALTGLIRDKASAPHGPVLVLLDEFLQLGAMPEIVKAMRTHTSAGVRFWLFIHSLPELKRLYPDSWGSVLSESMVKCFFGTDDMETADYVSRLTGDTTVAYEAATVSAGSGFNSAGDSGALSNSSQSGTGLGISLVGRPLMTPREVLDWMNTRDEVSTTMRTGLVFTRGTPPVRVVMLPWFTGRYAMSRIGSVLNDPIDPCPVLTRIWDDINARIFDGRLKPLASVHWEDTPAQGRASLSGMYIWEDPRRILITSDYKPAQEVLARTAHPDFEFDPDHPLYRLMVHEMLHQAVHEETGYPLHDHTDPAYVAIVERVARRVPYEAPTVETVKTWPAIGR